MKSRQRNRPTKAPTLRRAGYGSIVTLFVVWGTVAAAALLAARFEMWTDESTSNSDSADSGPVHAVIEGVRVDRTAWPRVIPPDSAARVALRLPGFAGFRFDRPDSSGSSPVRVALVWHGESMRAAWLVEARRPDCACPVDTETRWQLAVAVIDPLRGQVLDARVYDGVRGTDATGYRFTASMGGPARMPIVITEDRKGGGTHASHSKQHKNVASPR